MFAANWLGPRRRARPDHMRSRIKPGDLVKLCSNTSLSQHPGPLTPFRNDGLENDWICQIENDKVIALVISIAHVRGMSMKEALVLTNVGFGWTFVADMSVVVAAK